MADASPNLTASGLPKNYTAKKPLTVKGTLVNAEPGYPALASQSVFLDQIVAGQPLPVASGKTNSTGAYSFKYTPTSSGTYEVSTGQISMIENSTLSPVYGDILSPSSTSPVNVTVHAATSNFKVESQGGKALVLGTVGPGTGHVNGTITVLARAVGKHGAFKTVATERLASNQGNFAILAPLPPGGWNFKVKFSDRGQVVAATSRTVTVTIGPKPTSGITVSSFKPKSKGFTLAATATPSGEPGAKVELLRINTESGAPALSPCWDREPRRRQEQGDVQGQAHARRPMGAPTRVRTAGRGAEFLGLENDHDPLGPWRTEASLRANVDGRPTAAPG